MTLRISPARVEDAEALADLHLDVWEEAYADLMPASVFTERRARRAERVESWSTIIALTKAIPNRALRLTQSMGRR